MAAPQPIADNYTQPTLPNTPYGWKINSIDYQIITKSDGWAQSQAQRLAEYEAGKSLCGINYAALAVPYDNLTKYTNYVADARTKGLKIWHRSHWNRWQGDNSTSADLSAQDYLDDTYDFIVDNPTLFEDYDCFTTCVEANNADGVNSTDPFRTTGVFDFTKYNQFLKDQVRYANAAFLVIGKKVQTNLLSLSLSLTDLSGQTLDSGSGGNSSGLDNNDVVTYLNGILTIDHYLSSSYRYSDGDYWTKFSSDLDKIHAAFPDCKIMIGEWGYHTSTSVSESERAGMYDRVIQVLRSKKYIYGVNFWNHMGQTSSSIFTDSSGNIVTSGRTTADRIKHAFTTGNQAYGMRIRVS